MPLRAFLAAACLAAAAGCTARPKEEIKVRPECGFSKESPLVVASHPRDDLGLKEKLESRLRAQGFKVVPKGTPDAFLFSYEFEADLTGGFEPQFTLQSFVFQVARSGQSPAVWGKFSQITTSIGWKDMDASVAQIAEGLSKSLASPATR